MSSFTPLETLHQIAERENLSSLNSLEFAQRMDTQDELKEFRNEFLFPKAPEGKRSIYLCGNSLGLQPKGLRAAVINHLDKWEREGVEGHFTGEDQWVEVERPLKAPMAKLVGALDSEVVMMNSLTCNLHLMMLAFYKPTPTRFKIMIEKKAFPSDYHAVITELQLHGYDPNEALIEVGPREGELLLHEEDIQKAIQEHGSSIAMVLFCGVQYYTGQYFDLAKITQWGHEAGAIVGFDLAHAVGNIPLQLHDIGCDFACWCTYKYLNSGPGCMGGCFVHQRHGDTRFEEPKNADQKYLQAIPVRLAGWWGHRISDRFIMNPTFTPEPGADGFRLSNPPVLLVACLIASLSVFDKAGIHRLRHKSLHLTTYLEHLLKEELNDIVEILTPSDPARRGCQLSLAFKKEGVTCDEVLHKLGEHGVIGDVRKPNVIRIAPAPLYNTYQDVYEFVHILKLILR